MTSAPIPLNLNTAIRVLTRLGTNKPWPDNYTLDDNTYRDYVNWFIETNHAGSFFEDDPVLTPEGSQRLKQLEFASKMVKQVIRKTSHDTRSRVGERLLLLYMTPSPEHRQAIDLFEAAMRAYHYLSRIKQHNLSVQTITSGFGLPAIRHLSLNKHLPATLKEPLMRYLYRLPGYCLRQGSKTPQCRQAHTHIIKILGLRRLLLPYAKPATRAEKSTQAMRQRKQNPDTSLYAII